jgi:predicted unusual protein kinase regulating ubiquinone biosynthesis (AarF/ABC1/UbiB family)
MVAQGAKRLTGEASDILTREGAEKLVSTLGDLKGMAMKLGQALSMESDLFPPEVQSILARLQNQAPAMGYSSVAEVIEDELGAPPEKCFERFEKEPFAAASLGQVHRAWMKDGREVAVKVQYPSVAKALQADLNNLSLLVKAFSMGNRLTDGRAYFEEFRNELSLEVDYRREAELNRAFAAASERLPDLRVPDVVNSHSTGRVLTLEMLPGATLKQFMESGADNAERFRVSRLLVRALQGPFLLGGVVHADPHPGNFLVMPDGKLGVLDFGSVKRPPVAFVNGARKLLALGVGGAPLDLLQTCRELGFDVGLPDAEARGLLQQITEISSRSVATDSYDYGNDQVVADMRNFGRANGLRLLKIRPPHEGILYFRALGGLVQNLRRLGATGNFRKIHQELLEMTEQPDRAAVGT